MLRRFESSRRILAGLVLGGVGLALLASCTDFGDEVVRPAPQPAVVHITITSHSDTVLAAVASVVQFTAVAHDARGNPVPGAPIQWLSSEVNVAAVDATGRATALTAGFTSIRARSGSIQSAPLIVRVHPVVNTVVITGPADPEVEIGRTVRLIAEARDAGGAAIPALPLDWTADDANIAAPGAGGDFVGVAEGTTNVRAAFGAVQSAPVALRVRPAQQPVASVEVSGPSQVNLGAMATFTAVARDAGGTVIPAATFTWSSSNPTIASIDANGIATGFAAGLTEIRATSESILSPPSALMVVNPAPSFATAIQPILNMNCNFSNCHGGSFPQAGLDLRATAAYTELVNQSSTQVASLLLVEPGNPTDSYFYRKVVGCGGGNCIGSRMPQGRPPLAQAQLDLIRDWILGGAQP